MLKDYIVHTHAKDGIRLIEKDAGDVYHAFVKGGAEAEEAFRSFKEVPLGCGGVNWGEYMAALRETGYDGFLTIEREGGENPASEIEEAAEFLKKII